jgi:hypothetical protein
MHSLFEYPFERNCRREAVHSYDHSHGFNFRGWFYLMTTIHKSYPDRNER